MKRQDYIDELISQGAYVLPPKKAPAETPVVTEPELVPESIPIPVQIESVAEALSKRWQDTTPAELPTAMEYSEEFVGPELTVGQVLDLIVVAWSFKDPTGKSRGGQGLARPHGVRGKGRRDGLLFKEIDIVSEGTIQPGTKIRGRLAEPISSSHQFTVVEISIYEN